MERYLRVLFLQFVMFFVSVFINQQVWASYSGPALKMPMQPGNSILCTVQAGGQIAPILLQPGDDPIDHWHTDANNGYYAIDFDDRFSGDVAVAVAAGKISSMVTTGCTNQGTACYVKLDHGGGYKTLYYHLAANSIPTSFYNGKDIAQGEILGTIGNTGDSYGAHLHFSISYNSASYSYTNELDGVEMEGVRFVDYVAGDYYNSTNDGFSTCVPVETTVSAQVNMVSIFPDTVDTSLYDLTSYYQAQSGGTLTLYKYAADNAGKVATNLTWLVGNVTNDPQADLVEITTNDTNTYANVYQSSGDGGFFTRTQWRRTASPAQYALLGDYNGDGLDDLILGYGISGSTKIQWKVCTSSGTTFNACTPWKDSFGYSGDKFVVGDFDGNKKVELLNGHDPDGATDNDCTNVLTWKRLSPAPSLKVTTVSTGSGYGSSQYLVSDADADGFDEVVEVRTCDGKKVTPVYVADYSSTGLTWLQWAGDVGAADGTYGLFDVTEDGYPDLTRWSSTRLAYLTNVPGVSTTRAFQEQDSAHDLIKDFPRPDNGLVRFADFGDYVTTIETGCDSSSDGGTGGGYDECDYDIDGDESLECGGTDCNDYDDTVYYGAPEICGNGLDDNCIGGDVPCNEIYCTDGSDNDLDGAVDCADSDCAPDTKCIALLPGCDQDGDHFGAASCGGDDCNDNSASVYYGATEICGNGVDDNCIGGDVLCFETYCTDGVSNDMDSAIDCADSDCSAHTTCIALQPGCDVDGDHYGATSCGGDDCNDTSPTVYYGATEICGNGIDDNCVGGDVLCTETYCFDGSDNDLDALMDCDDPDCSSNTTCIAQIPGCDADGDWHGAISCGGNDCNDGNAMIHPDAAEVCENNVDDNCDGSDAVCTSDTLGAYGCVLRYTTQLAPSIDACLTLFTDFTGVMMDDYDNDGKLDQLWLLSPRILSGYELCFLDPDDNGVGDVACSQWGDGTNNTTSDEVDGNDNISEAQGDCDDRASGNHPGALDICGDAFDNDCDSLVDETCILP